MEVFLIGLIVFSSQQLIFTVNSMIPNILVIDSTGKLGTKLLILFKNNIKIDSICCLIIIKLLLQSKNFKIKINSFYQTLMIGKTFKIYKTKKN